MKIQIFAVRDSALKAFAQPMFMPTIGVALRMFTDEVNRQDPNNALNKHPEDYELYHLGEFDDELGQFDEGMAQKSILRGKDALTK